MTTRLIQAKTGQPVLITLHPIAESILSKERKKVELTRNLSQRVFALPTADGANKILKEWVRRAGICKHITWSCARLSFSILLQDKNIDDATVIYLLGHRTTEQVRKTYKIHRPKDQIGNSKGSKSKHIGL